ncbi:hypothetical protein M408DRAFT_332815 [Serendipita vermifera MAFF 305830]|uniref:Uncharacterized protein n=1 Tax=Serendipita vermifera MAFF 305830 TaxID=933852 RepID=A0A0C3ARM8_SERVB|nr:hypothetical protein M408DRAFT_332815 [Serendipita vermifera MAFF 305830]
MSAEAWALRTFVFDISSTPRFTFVPAFQTPHSQHLMSTTEKLSSEVKMVLDADKQQAEGVGIVMALFAGALVSLAQIMEGVDPEDPKTTTASWQAMRVFLYGSVMLNLAGAFLSRITIKMCTDLSLAYH